jgi:prephenate dehydratase
MTKIIAFQGSIGANSYLACEKFYQDCKPQAYPTFYDVFKMVEEGKADYGMIPLENSYAGRVSEIHNLLQSSSCSIVGEHFLPISHNLAAIKGVKVEEITDVYSHPQALMQCQSNLRELNVEIHDYSNTAKAAEFVALSQDKTKAAICSKKAAQNNQLEIIKENMQDSGNDNVTVFIVISKNGIDPEPENGTVLTTLLFTIRNITGSLYKALGGFATNGVNMVKLESYIPGGASEQAKFFITIEGHPSEPKVALSLEELGFFSKNVKLLGVYYADEMRKK